MPRYTFDNAIYSDLYKDVYGYRPREAAWAEWNAMSDDEKQNEWECLCAELEEVMERENKAKDTATSLWWGRLCKMMTEHRIDLATAVRWDMDSHDVNGDYDYYEYLNSLGYGCVKETLAKNPHL